MRFDASLGPGRVFFSHDKGLELEWVAYQPLENHVGNVRRLLSHWLTDTAAFDLALEPEHRAYLFEHSVFHDWGKTDRFSISQTGKGWSYGFRGHRFLNPEALQKEPYALALERAHHDYSVQEIIKDAYAIAKHPAPEVQKHARRYPKDLFIFEMCDQIEAEIAVTVIEGEARNAHFMEFEVQPVGQATPGYLPYGKEVKLTLEPYPFEEDGMMLEIVVRRHTLECRPTAERLKALGFCPYEPDLLDVVKVTLQSKEPVQKVDTPSIEDFYAQASGFSPNELQQEVWQAWQETSLPGIIVKAPTGAGKTEACLYPPLAHRKRIVLILPAKALVDDHKRRFKEVFKRLSKKSQQQRRLLIDTGDTAELYTFSPESEEEKLETHNRHLYRADLIITTLDKFIYRFFGYGGARKSYIYPLRINDKGRMAFIFDEAHSYKGTAFTNFQRLVTTLYDNEHAVTLMTATLPRDHQTALQDPENHGFAGRWEVIDFLEERTLELGEQKGKYDGQRHLLYLPDAEAYNPEAPDPEDPESFARAKEAFKAHKEERVQRVLEQVHLNRHEKERLIVTLDQVKDAAEVYERLREGGLPTVLDSEEPQLFLYHGRLDRKWRSEVYARVKQLDAERKPYTLVSTSAIEIGVDLDAQVLITEVCNPDAFVQRMGRCNRRGYEVDARVVVIGVHIPTYLNAFGENHTAFEAYLELLIEHHDRVVDGAFSKAVMSKYEKPVLHDPRALTAFSMLYKYVYDHALEYENLHSLGFIATRSWDPALEVRIPMGGDLFESIQVPVTRLSRSTDDAKNILLERFNFTPDRDKNSRGEWEPVTRGGDLYRGTYRITLLEDSDLHQRYQARPDLGLVELPQVFQRQRWKSDPPLMVRLNMWLYDKSEDTDGAFYFAQDDKSGKRLVFSYLAEPSLTEV